MVDEDDVKIQIGAEPHNPDHAVDMIELMPQNKLEKLRGLAKFPLVMARCITAAFWNFI